MSSRRGRRSVPLSYRGIAGREVLVLAALLGGASLALFWLAGSQAPTRTIVDSVPYEEHGAFDYSTVLGRNVYDDDQLRIPQPLFRRLGERLPLTYGYEARSISPEFAIEDARGSYSLTAEVRQANGWVRTATMVPRTEFKGTRFDTSGVVDVAVLGEFVRRLEAETGYNAPHFMVRVRAHVEFAGVLRGERIERSLDQTLGFTLNEFELRLDREGTEIERTELGEVKFEATVPRTLTVPFFATKVAVAELPSLARLPLAASAVLLALVGVASAIELALYRTGASPPPIPARYRDRVIDVAPDSQPPPGARVQLYDLSSLLRLAEQYQSPVLRSWRGDSARYWVVADSVYVLGDPVATAWEPERPGQPEPSAPRGAFVEVPPAPAGQRASGAPTAFAEPAPPAPDAATPRPSSTGAWFALAEPRSARGGADSGVGSLGFGASQRAPRAPVVEEPSPAPLEHPLGVSAAAPPASARIYWGGVWRDEDDESSEEAA